ncbi:MAG: hypothetical protein RR342_01510 [Bacilli bacterium]|jgi:hypothetical protein
MTQNKNSTKYYSNAQERKVAKELGGKQVGGSGASQFSLGDVRLNKILVECKTSVTEKSSYSVKKEVLEKIEKESRIMHKLFYSLAFNFGPGTDNFYVIDKETMKYLCDKINEDYNN